MIITKISPNYYGAWIWQNTTNHPLYAVGKTHFEAIQNCLILLANSLIIK